MVSNYLTFLISYILIILSVVGHGVLAIKLTKTNISTEEIGFVGLAGIFFLILYSYITHFFVSHGYLHNIIFITIGLVSIYYYRSKILIKRNFIFLFSIFSIIFLAFVIFKTHDDFGYYHFPYSYYLNKFSMIIGTGSLSHGFRTPSSIFYLNSLFYFPYVEYYLYNIGATLIMGFSNIILISNINKFLKKENNSQFFFLSLLAFIFINIFFYRIAEHGTDRSAQILILLFFIYILSIRGNYENFDNILPKLIIFLSIIISLKSFYILYFVLIIPFTYYFFIDNKTNLLTKIFLSPLFYFSILVSFFVMLVYIFNTGCLLYPIQQTCIGVVEWSIPKTEVSALNTHYQWWSKAGGGPGYRSTIEPDIYIKNFNWISNWIDRYFFNKVSDFLLSLTLISVIFIAIFRSKKKKIKENSFQQNSLYFYFVLLLFIEWFFNHPSLRYGGYIIIFLIFSIPLSYFLSKYTKPKKFKYKVTIIIWLVISIFLMRNIDRIIYENEFYKANFMQNMFFSTEKFYFRIDEQLKKFSNNNQNCNSDSDTCFSDKNFTVKKNYGKMIILRNRN